jgi:hypothetical protein
MEEHRQLGLAATIAVVTPYFYAPFFCGTAPSSGERAWVMRPLSTASEI